MKAFRPEILGLQKLQPCRRNIWQIGARQEASKEEESPKKKGFGAVNQPKTASKPRKPRQTSSSVLEAYHRQQHRETSSEEGRETATGDSQEPAAATCVLRGVLLVGFSEGDAATLRGWFASIEPAFRVACCREEYLGRSMADLFDGQRGLLTADSQWQAPKELVPRAAIFSGMTKEEMLGLAEFWSLSGVKDPIFSSNVAAVSQKSLREVLLEIAQAYAANLAQGKEKMTAQGLKDMVRQKMDAKRKANAQGSHTLQPAHPDGADVPEEGHTSGSSSVDPHLNSASPRRPDQPSSDDASNMTPAETHEELQAPLERDVRVFEPVGRAPD